MFFACVLGRLLQLWWNKPLASLRLIHCPLVNLFRGMFECDGHWFESEVPYGSWQRSMIIDNFNYIGKGRTSESLHLSSLMLIELTRCWALRYDFFCFKLLYYLTDVLQFHNNWDSPSFNTLELRLNTIWIRFELDLNSPCSLAPKTPLRAISFFSSSIINITLFNFPSLHLSSILILPECICTCFMLTMVIRLTQ
jgi:hypothetical protein